MSPGWYMTTDLNPVEALHNGHLRDRRKTPLYRGLKKSECIDCPPKKVAASGGSIVGNLKAVKAGLSIHPQLMAAVSAPL